MKTLYLFRGKLVITWMGSFCLLEIDYAPNYSVLHTVQFWRFKTAHHPGKLFHYLKWRDL